MKAIYKALLTELAEFKRITLLSAKKMLTCEDVVLLTGLSKREILNLVDRREIPCYQPQESLIYFDRAEIDAWMKRHGQRTVYEAERIIEHLDFTRKTLSLWKL